MLNNIRNSLDEINLKQQLIDQYWNESTSNDLLDFYTHVATCMGNAERCSIFILNPETKTLWVQAGTGVRKHQIEVPEKGSMVGKVISTGEALFENDLESKNGAHQQVDSDTGFVTHNALCVPISSLDGDNVIGVIQLLNKNKAASFDNDDLVMLQQIARFMGFSIENIYLGQKTLAVSEGIYSTAQKIWYAFLGMATIVILVLFAYAIG